MTSIDARRATRPSATPYVLIALKLAMLDMKWSSLGMTGMLKVINTHFFASSCVINFISLGNAITWNHSFQILY
jgi:hypothetical protein